MPWRTRVNFNRSSNTYVPLQIALQRCVDWFWHPVERSQITNATFYLKCVFLVLLAWALERNPLSKIGSSTLNVSSVSTRLPEGFKSIRRGPVAQLVRAERS